MTFNDFVLEKACELGRFIQHHAGRNINNLDVLDNMVMSKEEWEVEFLHFLKHVDGE